jgi:hypothetical protein
VFLGGKSSKALQKTLYKKIVSKSFSKKSTKKSKTDFFSDFVYHVFGRFSVRGVKKHDKKSQKKNFPNPGTFLAPEEPTNHVNKARHFSLGVPLGLWTARQPAGCRACRRAVRGGGPQIRGGAWHCAAGCWHSVFFILCLPVTGLQKKTRFCGL